MDNNNNGHNGQITLVRSPIANGALPSNTRGSSSRGLQYEGEQWNPDNALALRGNLSSEALLGEGCLDPRHYVCDKARTLDGLFSTSRGVKVRSIDYPIIGTIGQVRAAMEKMFATGRSMPDVFQLPPVGPASAVGTFQRNVAPAPVTNAFPQSLGFVLDWGVSMLNFAPFDLVVSTANWVGEDLQPLNRSFVLRVNHPNGGSVYVPWAQRITPPMAMAQVQLARPLGDGGEGPAAATISVTNLPAAIFPSFNAQVTFITAFTPVAAGYAARAKLYGNIMGKLAYDAEGEPVYDGFAESTP